MYGHSLMRRYSHFKKNNSLLKVLPRSNHFILSVFTSNPSAMCLSYFLVCITVYFVILAVIIWLSNTEDKILALTPRSFPYSHSLNKVTGG